MKATGFATLLKRAAFRGPGHAAERLSRPDGRASAGRHGHRAAARSWAAAALVVALYVCAVGVAQNPADVDESFAPGLNAKDNLRAVLVQADGKIVVAGRRTEMTYDPEGNLIMQVCGLVARLGADGALDEGFNSGSRGENPADQVAQVSAAVLAADGGVVLGGQFTVFDSQARLYLARLQSRGELATGFHPDANKNVNAIALAANGQLVVAGSFTALGGALRNRVGRLNADGSLDTGFDTAAGGPDGTVWAVAAQPDGKVIIGGDFLTVDGAARSRLARLNGDGTLDESFAIGDGASGIVQAILVQPDGKVVVGGSFATFAGWSCGRVARLTPDGSLDSGFQPGAGADTTVYALALQPDGKLLVGGNFTSFNGLSRVRLARLNADGTVDETFDPGAGANTQVRVIALQPDGKILVGGNFSEFAGRAFNGLVRLQGEAASSVVKPSIVAPPQSQAVWAGGEVAFSVSAAGTPPLSYQWLRGQEPIAGATDSTLVLRNVGAALAGEYRVVVSNAAGSVTSDAALLTVMVPPRLDLRPIDAGFEVTISGQPGMRCTLECSTDLSNPDSWELLTELVLSAASQQWLDQETGPATRAKFYRVVVGP